MAKYLDYAGLQYLWTKIKNYVSTQPLGANVRYDAQTLTTAQQEQARKNIAAGGSNYNLLDNPFFQVNQRSFTTEDFGTSGNGYTVDRWKAYRSVVTVKSDGTIDLTPNSGAYGIAQFIAAGRLAVGETYTLSINIGGTIYSWAFVYPTTAAYSPYFGDGNRFYYHTSSNGNVDVWITGNANKTYNVRSMKLEKGSVSTLANDALSDYGTELRKCQYYFKRFSPTAYTALWGGVAVNATTAAVFVDGEMNKVNPTVSISGTGYLAQSTSMKIITSGSGYYTKQGTRLLLVTSATLTVNAPIDVCTSGNQDFVVDISAEPQ